MGTISDKLTYLNTTKGLIKDTINLTGAGITNDTFRSYANKLKLGLINALNDNGDTIYSNLEKVSGKGSNLSLTPTYEAPMRNREIYGNTLQNGTPTPSSPVPIQSVTGLQNVSIFKNNINNQGIRLGLYQIVDGNYASPSGANRYSTTNDLLPCKPNTTYTVTTKNNINAQFYELEYNSSKTYLNVNSSSNQSVKSYTFTTGANTYYMAIDIRAYDTTNYDVSYVGDIIIYDNNDSNTYEVNLGKNYFDKSVSPSSQNGTSTTELSTGIRATITSAGQNKYTAINLPNPSNLLGKTLTISATINISGTNTALIRFYWLNGNALTSLIANSISTTGSGQITIPDSFPTNTNGIAIVFSSNSGSSTSQVGDYVDYTNVQLEKGSTATSYSPYFTPIELNKIGDYEDSIKKSTGKNLLNAGNGRLGTFSGLTISYSNGDILLNGTASSSVDFYVGTSVSTPTYNKELINYMNTNLGTYTLSNNLGFENYFRIGGSYPQNTGTTTSTNKVDLIFVRIPAGTYNNKVLNIMLNEGSTSLPYEPYGKVWYIHKETRKLELAIADMNNSENYPGWVGLSQLKIDWSNINTQYLYNVDFYYKSNIAVQPTSSYDAVGINTIGNGTLYLNRNYFGSTYTQTYWETNYPNLIVTLVYNLKTPETTEITNTELIEQLETLYNAKSKNGTTNITITSEDLSMILNVSVLKGE